jgi:signal transduction histidine kinase/CheY-like chemotaxis protein/HPt (histidine-containing phosphotransfer) domain-containing protein
MHADRSRRMLVGLAALVAAACGVAAPWWARPGHAFLAVPLLGAAAALLLALRPVRREDADPAPPAAVTSESDLRSQLDALRAAQAELLLAKQATEAAMLAKDEFLATVSHEIRTPLNGVLPLLELALAAPLAAEPRDHLETAYRSAQEMLRIVDDILDYSKLDVGKLELESIGMNLRELVEAVAHLMRRNAEAKGLRLDVDIEPNVRLAVRGDPVRLRQVLTNLVSNAVKFTERGGVGIRLRRAGETPTHHEVAFEVRDSGIGIAPQAAEKLFRPFAQGDASITRAFGGTGLGLVICKRLVDLMGGEIGVQSEPGRGSLFWFRVPLAKVVGDLPSPPDLHGARALLVGGDETFLQRTRARLARLGLQTTAAANAADALAKLRSGSAGGAAPRAHVALVAIDAATLPARAAPLTRALLKDPAFAQVRIVLFDGHADEARADPARVGTLPRGAGERPLHALVERLFRTLPEGAPPPRGEAPPAAAHGPQALALSGQVLLVEDDEINLKVAQRLLALHGLSVDVAAHGEEALERLRRRRYDLVLMDCQMPVMDGLTASLRWREIERERGLPPTPIAAMTAYAMAGDRARCLASGMDDYLSKPISRTRLEALLRRWLAPADAPESPVPPPPAAAPVAATETEAAPSSAPAADEDAAADVLDERVVAELRALMGEEFGLLIEVYLEDTPRKLGLIGQAAAEGDAAAMIAQAHALKSSSENLGARTLAELARSLEEGLRRGAIAPAAAKDCAERLAGEYARAAVRLRALAGRAG